MDIHVVKDVLVPIVIGVLSSALFLFLASWVKPRIAISAHIAKMPPQTKGYFQPETGYVIKVINRSRRTAAEAKARLALVRKITVGGGQINQTDDFQLVKDFVFELPGKRRGAPEDSAFRFISYQNIEQEWEGSNYVIFSITAKDHLTGFSKVFSQSYYLKDDAVKRGVFRYGNSMEITPVEAAL